MEEVNKKLKVGEVRKEIGNLKKGLFKNVAVMRSDDLRAYLDDLRYAENVINAKKATGMSGPTEEHKDDGMVYEKPKKEKKIEIDTDSEESEKEEKKIVKKVVKKVKEVEKEIKKDKPKSAKKEIKKLEEIPKELKKMVKDHMKLHPDHSEKKALGVVKKSLMKVLS